MKYQFDLEIANTKEFFDENGFVIFKNVFTIDEVKSAREVLLEIFNVPSAYDGDWDNGEIIKSIRADIFNRYAKTRNLFYNQKVLEAIKSILGNEIAFVPEMVGHKQGFGGWHKDTTSQENAGNTFHYEKDWLMIECAIYLQDNDENFGGGLDVIPGSHKEEKDRFLTPKKGVLSRLVKKLLNFDYSKIDSQNVFSIPSKAGDFIFFNKRLVHRSTPFKQDIEIPKAKEKLALFFVGGKNNGHLNSYFNYIKSRKDYKYLKNFEYQMDFLNECKQNNITLVS